MGEAETKRDKTFVFTLVAIGGIALFLIPSAWIVHRGWPRVLAAVVGALAFPLLPGVWQFIAERKRKRSDVSGTLTASDRLLMRVIAVGLVFIVPLLVFDRARTWAAVKKHNLWFTQWSSGHITGDGSEPGVDAPPMAPISADRGLLAFVPADAEAIVWVRSAEHVQYSMSGKRAKPSKDKAAHKDAKELVYSVRDKHYMLVSRVAAASIDLDEMRKDMKEAPASERLEVYHPKPHTVVATKKAWAPAVKARIAGGPGPEALTKLLAGFPDDAFVVAAALPKTQLFFTPVERATGWISLRGKRIHVEVKADVIGNPSSLRDELRARLDGAVADTDKDCKESAKHITDAVTFAVADKTLKLVADIDPRHVLSLVFCAAFNKADDNN